MILTDSQDINLCAHPSFSSHDAPTIQQTVSILRFDMLADECQCHIHKTKLKRLTPMLLNSQDFTHVLDSVCKPSHATLQLMAVILW